MPTDPFAHPFAPRVNSKQGTQFRIWATQVLREHILQGYTLNEKRLQAEVARLAELQNAVDVMGRILVERSVSGDEAQGLLKVITDYSLALRLLTLLPAIRSRLDTK